jgi:hypothetical protein
MSLDDRGRCFMTKALHFGRGPLVALLTTAALSGCPLPAQTARRTITTASAMAHADTSAAESQFIQFLSLAVATRVPRLGLVDSVYTCDETEGRHDMKWVAAGRVLSVSTRGDSGRATAVITTVAHQTERSNGYDARYRIHEDTAHWDLVRNIQTGGKWMVCGDALEGFGIFHIGRSVRWVQGSRAEALAAADSVRRARGLPILR